MIQDGTPVDVIHIFIVAVRTLAHSKSKCIWGSSKVDKDFGHISPQRSTIRFSNEENNY